MKLSGLMIPVLAMGLGCATHLSAAADSWDEFTYITFSAPVAIPGHALPAGTYLFQVADIWSNQETIEIYTADKRMLVARVVTQPIYNFEPAPPRTIVQIANRPAVASGALPGALTVWFPRGQRWGHRFVYPQRRQVQEPETLGSR